MVEGARREAEAAFGDGTVFLERYVERPRHVEVQVFADTHGNVVALFERDCSIQRRHQKVVEEAPSPRSTTHCGSACPRPPSPPRRRSATSAPARSSSSLDPDGEFFFLEMNTRLQVEHPVTELVTGLDLVALQIRVGAGRAAAGRGARADADRARDRGPALRRGPRRLPARDRNPVGCSRSPHGTGVRVDSGVETGSVVGVHYDAMLAKVIAHGATREEATARLAGALDRARIHGVVTNRDLLVGVLRSPAWLGNEVDTGFFDRNDPAVLGAPPAPDVHRTHCVAAALAAAAGRTAQWPSGWRNLASQPQSTSYDGVVARYVHGRDGLRISVDGTDVAVQLFSASSTEVDMAVDGVRRRFQVAAGEVTYVDSPLGHSALTEDPRFPVPGSALAAGSLIAPMPGTVLRVTVSVGDEVKTGDALVVLEAMKMEHSVKAQSDGTVTDVLVEAGRQVDSGSVLVVVTAPD